MSVNTPPDIDVASRILTSIGQDPGAPQSSDALGRSLRACSREQLLGFARQLGITGVTKLAKDPLASRVAAALEAVRVTELPPPAVSDAKEAEARAGSFPEKFDLGPEVEAAPPKQNIPWGYGYDRVTAMPVDPKRLYVYWEVTDDAIKAARRGLGGGGADAWLNLRVYDTTGRLFDGTNAHSYFDHGLDRETRQWFFEINKPSSTAHVEIGLKSPEGFFVKIARSSRVDFPRDAPVGEGAVEWLTVRSATGFPGHVMQGGAPIPDQRGGGAGGAVPGGGGQGADDWQGWTENAGFPVPGQPVHEPEHGWEYRELLGETFETELERFEWAGPVHRSEWQAGPFSYPVEVPTMLETHETGEVSMRTENGHLHVVYGPWQVVIRGVGARAERRVLATWEYRRTVDVAGGAERFETAGRWELVGPGASEWRYVPGGASERRWIGSSELLVRGGSEVYMLGASERMMRGASERLLKGASERLYRGASERLLRGASERLMRGASEKLLAGASERLHRGASESLVRSGSGMTVAAEVTEVLAYPRSEGDVT